MREIIIRPIIYRYNEISNFVEEFQIGKGDLVLTNEFIFIQCLKKYNLECEFIFQEKYGNGEPTDEMVSSIVSDIKNPYERVFAIGGGSIIDISKILILKNFCPVQELFEGKIEPQKERELIVVPTTCGTGSEVTNVSILNLVSKGTKKGLAVDELYPDKAVLIPQLLDTLPFYVFATSSIDALIHGIESALSPYANETTRMFSYRAIDIILNGYKKIRANGKDSVKCMYEQFLLASNYAGIAFGNAGCAAVHALSYPLGAVFHVAHGEANYAMFTAVMKMYLQKKTDGEMEKLMLFLADILECAPNEVFSDIEELLNCIIPKKRLRDYGVKKEDIYIFADSVVENQQRLLKNNYVELSTTDIQQIYISCF